MVRARLHIICGNCGAAADEEWELSIEHHDHPEDAGCKHSISLGCPNCSTLHFLNSDLFTIVEEATDAD